MNRGLSHVINEVIICLSEVMEDDSNQELVLKLLKILNNHHSDLIQRTINKTDYSIDDSFLMSCSTID